MSFIADTTNSSVPAPTPAVDPHGVDLAISATGDLVVNASGALTAVSGPYNCAQALSVRMRTAPGELPLHPAYGSNVAAMFVGAPMNVAALVLQMNADLQQMLAEDVRFRTAKVTSWAAPASAQYPSGVQVAVTAVLAGGEQVSLENVTEPSPSDVTVPQPITPGIDPTLTYDPMAQAEFFASEPEFDQLLDLNTLQAIVNDTPGASILGTGG